MIVLRPDQQNLKTGIYDHWNSGRRNVLGVLPTGGGKSVIVSDIALDISRMNRRQAIIAHRNELVAQMSMHIAKRGIPHRIIGADKTVSQIIRQHRKVFNKSFVNPSALASVVGVDTLVSRADNLKEWAAQNDYWTIDEAHHVLRENKWGTAVEMFPNALGLGVTATPCRADGRGLGRDYEGVFDEMVIGPDMRYLINIGALSDYEVVCPTSDLELREDEIGESGDWSNKKLREAVKRTESRIVGDVLKSYCRFAWGRQAICFATDVETANDIAKRFNDAGIRAASVSAKTNEAVREKYIEDFKSGKILVLVNVDLFDEGFDVPACDVVIMARPTASLGKYRQMVGRALRYVAGKIALIIDHVSNIVRHGLPDKFINWSLTRRDKRAKQEKDPEELDYRVCTSCTKPYERYLTACKHCGAVPDLPEPKDRSIKTIDGDLILLDRAKLELMREATIMEAPASVGERVSEAAGSFAARGAINRQIEKFAAHDRLKNALAQWAGIQRHKGLNDREIQKKFYLATGIDVLTALDGSQTKQQIEEFATKIEGWYMK